ncbi:MAG: transglycosylase domain-containing protein [Kouleothrix sp.]
MLDPELARQRTLARKLREAALALKLTASYPKDEILELYLNHSGGGLWRRGGGASVCQHARPRPGRVRAARRAAAGSRATIRC